MKKLLPTILILAGIAFLILGIVEYNESRALIEIGDLEISAGSKSPGKTAMTYLVLGGVGLLGGLLLHRKN